MSNILPAPSGFTLVEAYAADAIFHCPVVAFSYEWDDGAESPRGTPLIPQETEIAASTAPFQRMVWPGAEPSDITAIAREYFAPPQD